MMATKTRKADPGAASKVQSEVWHVAATLSAVTYQLRAMEAGEVKDAALEALYARSLCTDAQRRIERLGDILLAGVDISPHGAEAQKLLEALP
jgi:ribosomal protein L16/L10AE